MSVDALAKRAAADPKNVAQVIKEVSHEPSSNPQARGCDLSSLFMAKGSSLRLRSLGEEDKTPHDDTRHGASQHTTNEQTETNTKR
jgi:hypothetical protein